MRVAILSSFPPEACGIADYAEQQAARLEAEGHEVDRIPLEPLRHGGWSGPRLEDLERRFAAADRAIVHYQIGLFKDETRAAYRWKYLAPQAALIRLLRRHRAKAELVLHESYFLADRAWPYVPFQYAVAVALYGSPGTVVFHTRHEMDLFRRRFPRRRGLVLRPHHADFVPRTQADRSSARRLVGIPEGDRVFLCIGFYTAAKGFEGFAERFDAARRAGLLPPEARLHVVTSVRLATDRAGQAALADLVRRWAGHEAVHVHDRYVSAEDFDAWIAASDVVALPYRSTYSSGVAARARLLGRTLLAARVGGLPEQLGPGDVDYGSDAELDAALARLGQGALPATPR